MYCSKTEEELLPLNVVEMVGNFMWYCMYMYSKSMYFLNNKTTNFLMDLYVHRFLY